METKFTAFSDNIIDNLEEQVREFFNTVTGSWSIKHLAHSSAYDKEADHVVFSVFIIYETNSVSSK